MNSTEYRKQVAVALGRPPVFDSPGHGFCRHCGKKMEWTEPELLAGSDGSLRYVGWWTCLGLRPARVTGTFILQEGHFSPTEQGVVRIDPISMREPVMFDLEGKLIPGQECIPTEPNAPGHVILRVYSDED